MEISCRICGREYQTIKSLKRHVKRQHTNTYFCTYCDKQFTRKQNSILHMNLCSRQRNDLTWNQGDVLGGVVKTLTNLLPFRPHIDQLSILHKSILKLQSNIKQENSIYKSVLKTS